MIVTRSMFLSDDDNPEESYELSDQITLFEGEGWDTNIKNMKKINSEDEDEDEEEEEEEEEDS